MAAYKAEFMSQHYEKRPRPLRAQAMARIGEWAPLAAKLPRLANLLSSQGKKFLGMAAERCGD